MSKEIVVGNYNTSFNSILGCNYPDYEIYRSKGLIAHLLKRHHESALKFIDDVPDIINNPDFIGINPNDFSLEYVKQLKKNVHIGIKVDTTNNRMYVATMYIITDAVISRYLNTGRLKKVIDENNNSLYNNSTEKE